MGAVLLCHLGALLPVEQSGAPLEDLKKMLQRAGGNEIRQRVVGGQVTGGRNSCEGCDSLIGCSWHAMTVMSVHCDLRIEHFMIGIYVRVAAAACSLDIDTQTVALTWNL